MDMGHLMEPHPGARRFRSTDLDIALALAATFLLPLACSYLFDMSGALLPMLLYYGVFCILLVRWRKGSLEYARPLALAPALFFTLLAVQLLAQACGAMTIVPVGSDQVGIVLTLVIWVPLNALMEQLLWIYIYDAFACRTASRNAHIALAAAGLFMTLSFVGLIHALFWGRFLPSYEAVAPWTAIFFAAQFIMTVGYVALYKRTGSMWLIFPLHLIADASLVLFGQYSILADLWR
jgi:uncharacterized membrane protein